MINADIMIIFLFDDHEILSFNGNEFLRSDPKWAQLTDDQRRELDLTIEDDGEFWMSFDDYLSIFTHTTICRVVNLNPNDEQVGFGF